MPRSGHGPRCPSPSSTVWEAPFSGLLSQAQVSGTSPLGGGPDHTTWHGPPLRRRPTFHFHAMVQAAARGTPPSHSARVVQYSSKEYILKLNSHMTGDLKGSAQVLDNRTLTARKRDIRRNPAAPQTTGATRPLAEAALTDYRPPRNT
ncbi:hypothetical protein NDU88_003246 [Pleurodeles waltl]|uniref:Uncharacterized protein n=1 Tax=Pleurodeles waltl TaxID=8319 RepID=A0AAV7UZG5_PLEWA|nr:hypothetical protein NDU88_003246 [Pleurodeles waltl]